MWPGDLHPSDKEWVDAFNKDAQEAFGDQEAEKLAYWQWAHDQAEQRVWQPSEAEKLLAAQRAFNAHRQAVVVFRAYLGPPPRPPWWRRLLALARKQLP